MEPFVGFEPTSDTLQECCNAVILVGRIWYPRKVTLPRLPLVRRAFYYSTTGILAGFEGLEPSSKCFGDIHVAITPKTYIWWRVGRVELPRRLTARLFSRQVPSPIGLTLHILINPVRIRT